MGQIYFAGIEEPIKTTELLVEIEKKDNALKKYMSAHMNQNSFVFATKTQLNAYLFEHDYVILNSKPTANDERVHYITELYFKWVNNVLHVTEVEQINSIILGPNADTSVLTSPDDPRLHCPDGIIKTTTTHRLYSDTEGNIYRSREPEVVVTTLNKSLCKAILPDPRNLIRKIKDFFIALFTGNTGRYSAVFQPAKTARHSKKNTEFSLASSTQAANETEKQRAKLQA